MSEGTPQDRAVAGDLQFDQAEYAAPSAAPTCAACQAAITGAYFEANGSVLCAACRDQLDAALHGGSPVRRAVRAALFGFGAAVAGAALYFAVRALSGLELSLISIVVGLMVGRAVRAGADGRGGWFYQSLAVFLTYSAIISTYVPFIIKGLAEHAEKQKVAAASKPGAQAVPPTAAERVPAGERSLPRQLLSLTLTLGYLVALLYAIPFLAGAQNIMGLIIIGIGVFEAWRVNKRVPITITGPYQLGGPPPPAGVPGHG